MCRYQALLRFTPAGSGDEADERAGQGPQGFGSGRKSHIRRDNDRLIYFPVVCKCDAAANGYDDPAERTLQALCKVHGQPHDLRVEQKETTAA